MADVTWVVVDREGVETMVDGEREAKKLMPSGGHYGVIVHKNGHYVRRSPRARDYADERERAKVKGFFDSIIAFSYGTK